jgi:hypothetical protein
MAMDSELGGEVEIADPEPEGPKHNIPSRRWKDKLALLIIFESASSTQNDAPLTSRSRIGLVSIE